MLSPFLLKNVATTHHRVLCVSNAWCEICAVEHKLAFSFLSKPHPHKEWGPLRRSRGMPGLVHIKKEDHLGMDGTRSDRTVRRKPTSGLHAPRCLDCIRASSEASRDVKIHHHHHPLFKGCMYFHEGLTASRVRRVPSADQRAGRVISGSQSLERRLSSQNMCSFSRAGSSHEPSAGLCGKQMKKSWWATNMRLKNALWNALADTVSIVPWHMWHVSPW